MSMERPYGGQTLSRADEIGGRRRLSLAIRPKDRKDLAQDIEGACIHVAECSWHSGWCALYDVNRELGIEASFSNPQPNPQNAMSCTTWAAFGSPRVLVSCCKTSPHCGCHGRGRGFESRRPRHFKSTPILA
jgi:hypothetical protein